MRKIGNGVVHGGTYTAHSVSLAAAEKTLEILDGTSALADIARYGERLQQGISHLLNERDIAHSFVGHPSMGGMFFSATPPTNYRDWVNTDYTFYETLAPQLHERGIIVEPNSREPWFVSAAHDESCLRQTMLAFEQAVDISLQELKE